jgi:hypothetical protein
MNPNPLCRGLQHADSIFPGADQSVLETGGSPGIQIVKTPVRAPKANTVAERFVRTVRAECLDWLLILNRHHLEHVLRVYVEHYNLSERTVRLHSGRPSLTSDAKDPATARSTGTTDSAASSTSTTQPPPENRHE